MIKSNLRLEAFYNGLKQLTNMGIFDIDIAKDELDSNSSFFLYHDKGRISKGDNGRLNREFTLMFVTKENKEIDEYAIIEESPKWGLVFRNTESDYGKIADTQELVRTTTFYFVYEVRTC